MPIQQALGGSVPISEERALGRLARLAVIAIAVPFMLAACLPSLSDLNPLNLIGGDDEEDENRLEGERISVLSLEQTLEADPDLADIEVALPPPYVNDEWPQPGGYATHAMHHLQIPAEIKEVWRAKAGQGSEGGVRLTAPPVVGAGKVFVRDAIAGVSAFDAESGERLWEISLRPPKTKSYMGTGGGVAFAEGKVFASTGFGFVVALDSETGTEIWRQSLGLAIRSAPTVGGGRLFISTFDNQLFALSTTDGRIFWNHRAIPETARLLVSSSPAVSGDVVIAPFSSGEIFALRVQNGRVAWNDALQRTGQLTPLATLNDIAGRPVIDRGRVIAVSHNGRMVSIDMRSGERVWTRDIGSVQTPWVAGDYIYVVSIDSEVICLSRRDGRIRWITPLQQFENVKKKKDPIHWSGPLLAGDRLIVVSSHGEALSVSPYTGEILGHIDLPDGSFISPIVANETVYLLTDDAKLVALR